MDWMLVLVVAKLAFQVVAIILIVDMIAVIALDVVNWFGQWRLRRRWAQAAKRIEKEWGRRE